MAEPGVYTWRNKNGSIKTVAIPAHGADFRTQCRMVAEMDARFAMDKIAGRMRDRGSSRGLPWNLLSGFRLKHRRDMSVTVLFRQVLVIEFSLILWNAGRGTDLCPRRVSIAIEIFDA